MEKAKVYFTKIITPEKIVEMYKVLNKNLEGKIAIKVHSGEAGNQNYLKPEFMKPIVDYVNGTIVECNTAYDGERNTTIKHEKIMNDHLWTKYFNVDLMDSEGEITIDVPHGKIINKDIVGSHINNYDSVLVLSHFKGHPMGGYGGALKQLSIGFASANGKAYIHSAGKIKDPSHLWENIPEQDLFLESMADAASAVVNYFKGNMVFINIMCNMSVDCDCCAVAEDPCMKDIGILSSLDPVALDKACLDLVYQSNDSGKDYLIERIESRHGTHTVESASVLGIGTTEYELINLDK